MCLFTHFIIFLSFDSCIVGLTPPQQVHKLEPATLGLLVLQCVQNLSTDG